MTLFTKPLCSRCDQLKEKFDLSAMQVQVEVLDNHNADSLAHLAWHGLVETARKTLPILVLDDSSAIDDFSGIENQLIARAEQFGLWAQNEAGGKSDCADGKCAL